MQRMKGVALLLVVVFFIYLLLKLIFGIRKCYRRSQAIELDSPPPPATRIGCWKRIRIFRVPCGSSYPPPSVDSTSTPGFRESGPPGLLPPGWTKAPAPSPIPSYESTLRAPGIPPYYWELMSQLADQSEANLEKIVKSIKDNGSSSNSPSTPPTAPEAAVDMESAMESMDSASNPGNNPLPQFPQGPICPQPPNPAPEESASPSERTRRDPASEAAGTATESGPRHRAILNKGVPESLDRMRKLIASQH